ncbi:hypothetical protein [Endozoicomonas sp. ONNA2]|uniref:hypothetical protein n=1 Tax=Endozoicomonas sp. ONNA2 TaxID=2828741 RepID=UPI00214820E5|nr:hypothetical protein [Endozoicomonas sp. ONNA2]
MLSVAANIPSLKDISQFEIGDTCHLTIPCQHYCKMHFKDGTIREVKLFTPSIDYLINNLPESKVKNSFSKYHFDQLMSHISESEKVTHLNNLKSYIRLDA